MAIDADQRRKLYLAKTRALARDRFAVATPDDHVAMAFGAAVVGDGQVVAYLADDPTLHLGAMLAWGIRNAMTSVSLLVDDAADAEVLARRASALRLPIATYVVDGTSVVEVEAGEAPAPIAAPDDVGDLLAIIREAGLEVIVEHGVITGELFGLEMARIVDLPEQGLTLDVGVGKFDQEAGAMLRGATAPAAALHAAVAQIAEFRSPEGAAGHGLQRVGRERWLRSVVIADPALVGLTKLEAVEPPMVRRGNLDAMPACALGVDAAGNSILVVCAAGADLEFVSHAADLSVRHRPDRVLVVTAAAEPVAIIDDLAALLRLPANRQTLPPPWPL